MSLNPDADRAGTRIVVDRQRPQPERDHGTRAWRGPVRYGRPETSEVSGGTAAELDERGFPAEELSKVLRLKERLGDLWASTVYEPGCGTGRMTGLLLEWVGPQGRVVAVDNERQRVETALRNVQLGNGASRPNASGGGATVHCADAETFPVPPRAIDLILFFCAFPHFENPGGVLQHVVPALRSDGRLIIAELEGSRRLNAIHTGAGERVLRDRMPSHTALTQMLADARLRLLELVDRDEEFYLEAVPVT